MFDYAEDDTATVSVTVSGISKTPNAGRLLGIATVDLVVEGIEIQVTGLRLVRSGDRRILIEPPSTRDAQGQSIPCIGFPDEVLRAIELAISREPLDALLS